MSGILEQDTRQRILTAAREVFADFGFQGGTIRDIVERARVNQAAVNYHFQSKERLYQEVLRLAFPGNGELSSMESLASLVVPPEEKLRSLVGALLSDLGHQDTHAQNQKLLAWEILYPTGMMERMKHATVFQHLKAICDIVRPFFPHQADDFAVSITALWLLGQCLVFHRYGDHLASTCSEQSRHLTLATTEQTIRLVTELALKGLMGNRGT